MSMQFLPPINACQPSEAYDGCPDLSDQVTMVTCDPGITGWGKEFSLLLKDGSIRSGTLADLTVWEQMMDHLRYVHGVEAPGAATHLHRHAWFRAAVALLMD